MRINASFYFDRDNTNAFLQHKIYFCRIAVFLVEELEFVCSKRLRYIVSVRKLIRSKFIVICMDKNI
jgi:hypothetical protein